MVAGEGGSAGSAFRRRSNVAFEVEAAQTVLAANGQGSFWPLLARAMRPHHWVKNLLIFTPVVFHHSFFDLRLWSLSGLAFALFCLATSAVYLLNDLLDVNRISRRPVKKIGHLPAADCASGASADRGGGFVDDFVWHCPGHAPSGIHLRRFWPISS